MVSSHAKAYTSKLTLTSVVYSGVCDLALAGLAWKIILSLTRMKLPEKIGVAFGLSMGAL